MQKPRTSKLTALKWWFRSHALTYSIVVASVYVLAGFVAISFSNRITTTDGVEASVATSDVKIMSYNILNQLTGDKENPNHKWSARKNIVGDYIKNSGASVVGLQEAEWRVQRNDIKSRLGSNWAMLEQNTTAAESRQDRTAIVYNKTKVTYHSKGVFTVNTKNAGRPDAWTYYTTWARFMDKKSGMYFYVFNVHLDHEPGHAMRDAQMAIILSKVNTIVKNKYDAVIMTGDFNATTGTSPMKKTVAAGYLNTRNAAQNVTGLTWNTWSGFKPLAGKQLTDGYKRDHILFKKNDRISAITYKTDKDAYKGSDHLPVWAVLRFTPYTVTGGNQTNAANTATNAANAAVTASQKARSTSATAASAAKTQANTAQAARNAARTAEADAKKKVAQKPTTVSAAQKVEAETAALAATAKAKADAAKKAADAAQAKATEAKNAANTAKAKADEAVKKAAEAKKKADEAMTTANKAAAAGAASTYLKDIATAAQTKANAAAKAASTALAQANAAVTAANAAQTTANTAKQHANEAITASNGAKKALDDTKRYTANLMKAQEEAKKVAAAKKKAEEAAHKKAEQEKKAATEAQRIAAEKKKQAEAARKKVEEAKKQRKPASEIRKLEAQATQTEQQARQTSNAARQAQSKAKEAESAHKEAARDARIASEKAGTAHSASPQNTENTPIPDLNNGVVSWIPAPQSPTAIWIGAASVTVLAIGAAGIIVIKRR